jgi:hypothetical protein
MTDMNEAVTTADAKHKFEEKYRRGIFAPVARHLREDLVEDRMADAMGLVFQMYAKSVAEGRPMDDAVLVRAVHMRAIDVGRTVAGAGGGQPKRDVYDERNYKNGTVEVLRLDGLLDDGDEEQGLFGRAEVMANNPSKKIVSAIDLERWLLSLDPGDRLMLALRQAGHTLGGIGAATGKSTSVVFKRLRELGEELAEVAEIDVGTGRAS